MKKKASHSDRMKQTKKNIKNSILTMNSEYSKEIDNPFNKVIDRHFGSFKCNILGNYKNVFNSLNINSIKPLGNQGGVKRKLLKHEKFTAIFYCSKNKGSVELKIPRNSLFHKQAIKELHNSYYQVAIKAKDILEKYYHVPLSIPVQNRLAKYGVEDSAARSVNLEIEGKKRKMDASNRLIAGKFVRNVSHVDNFGSIAAKADARLSSKQHDLISSQIAKRQGLSEKDGLAWRIAKGNVRLKAPELLESIETALFETAEASRFLGKNMVIHVGIMKEIKEGLHKLSFSVRSVRPTKQRFPTSFKKSASVKGCS